MAIFQPAFVVQRVGADFTITATVAGDVSAYALRAQFRDQLGAAGTVIATKTTGAGIVATYSAGPGTTAVVITLVAADTASLTPGPYVWHLARTDSGQAFDLIDWSTILLTPTDTSGYPQLTNLSELLAHLGYSETPSDADVKAYLQLVAAAEQAVRDLCGRHFNYATYTELPDCCWTRQVILRETPVNPTDIIANYDRSRVFGTDTQLVYGTDYLLSDLDPTTGWSKTGLLTRLEALWEGEFERRYDMLTSRPVAGRGILSVSYAGGFALIPGDLKLAVWEIVADRLSSRRFGVPLQSEAGMNYSYNRADWAAEAAKLLSVQAVINNYRRGDSLAG